MQDPGAIEGELVDTIRKAYRQGTPLSIQGGLSKSFYGRTAQGEPLPVAGLCGITAYRPTELVVTVRAGTSLATLEATLAAAGQMLACEPPHFAATATVGGMVAAGLAGPRRPYAGGVRDCVLGVRCVNGAGEVLRFGGEVMKNVAGFDCSRLMVGALGTLGLLLDCSLKVVPRPEYEITLHLELDTRTALAWMNRWAGLPLPISGAAYLGNLLYVRGSGSAAALTAVREAIPAEELEDGHGFWQDLREQRLAFFLDERPLWRILLAPATPPLSLDGNWLIDWGGAQRWLKSDATAHEVRREVDRHAGDASLFRGGDRSGPVFTSPSPALMAVQRRLKQVFDPKGILNPGRLYPE
ncbi:MAG: glycolate oxidase subunit GlcE [Gammaproteobacteria bacterium]